ncbi:MAG TPA: TIGR03118 family protein, partial [Candidatus Eremiobacteraceae bacterium]|nr:TIGR03118 family protein [Candidatus Eremiobacteraceae bacterium]
MRFSFVRSVPAFLAMLTLIGAIGFSSGAASASSAYQEINLTSNMPGMAHHTDPNLVNGWGMAAFPGSPFWISDNATGLSTLYDGHGAPQSLVVTIPAASEQPAGTVGTPTGIVANATSAFVVSENGASGPGFFLFDTLDGTISGWNPSVDLNHAVVAVDEFSSHALFTGLAVAKTMHGPRLYAADAVNNRIDVFDGTFRKMFSFTDPTVPNGFSVYAVHLVQGFIFVTFTSQSNNPGGVVDIFDFNGRFIKRFASNGSSGPLEAPWGIAAAGAHFGVFSNALLIANESDGHISAFNAKTGAFLGQMKDAQGNTFAIPGLWSIEFGSGGGANGNADELFFS